ASGSNAGDAQMFSLSTVPASNGSIGIAGNVTASSIVLAAGGSGAITGSGGTLIGDTIDLSSTSGSIGGPAFAQVQTAPDTAVSTTVSANTGGNGNVFITNTGSAILGQSTSGGSFSFTSTGALTVSGAVTTASGGGALVANAGVLSVAAGTKITVNQGNLLIQNQNPGAGSIQIGAGAVIATASSTKTQGVIDIVIGT